MDIVPLNTKSRKTSVRRHTTELKLEHLPWNNTPNMDFLEPCLSQGSLTVPRMEKTTSSNSIHSDMDTSGEFYDHGAGGCSQGGIQQELLEIEDEHVVNNPQHSKYLSYEQALVEGNIYPALVSQGSQRRISHASHVITEIVTTERNYVTDLHEIIEGYYTPLASKVGIPVYSITEETLNTLFGNIEAIKDFNSQLLQHLEENKSADSIGRCFLNEVEKFKLHYSSYCNNYANSVKVLAKITKDTGISRLLKDLQKSLGHMLPLGAFLLKPVQRVLRYPLLLKDLDKHLKPSDDHGLVKNALVEMTKVAEHINTMKKKYEESDVKIQEIQSLIRGAETPDLTKYGDLVMEDTFRSLSGRFRGSGVRHLYLFQRLLLVIKKEDEGYQYKTHLEMKDIQLTENMENKNAFEIRSISTGQYYTFQAFTAQAKKKWVDAIKKQLVESLPQIPDKAKQLILGGFPTEQKNTRGHINYEGKSKTISGRIRSATANVPIKRPVSNPAGSQSATTAPERAFSPTKFLVAGLVGGGQMFFPQSDTTASNPVIEESAVTQEETSHEDLPPSTSDEKIVATDQTPPNLAQDRSTLPHLHRKNCIRKPSPMNIGHHSCHEVKPIPVDNGTSLLKIPIDATSHQSSDNEHSTSQQGSDVSASSPSPEKPLTPGGSLDTEQLFGELISASNTSPKLPFFPVPSSSLLNSTLSPDEATPVDSPKQPRAGYEAAFEDIVLPPPPVDDSLTTAGDPVVILDEPIIIPAPPEFSECSQHSNDSGTHPLTASGSMQVIQDVIFMMEQNITQSQENPAVFAEELQAAQPCMQNISTVGVGSEQTLSCSSSSDSQRAAVAMNTSNTPTNTGSDSPKAQFMYDSSSSEIQIAIVARSITPNESHMSPKTDLPRMHNVLRHALTFDGTRMPNAETTPKASRLDGTRTPNAETTPKASRLDGTRTPNAETTPKASRLDGTRTPNAETTPKASRLDGTRTPNAETTPKASRPDGTRLPNAEIIPKASRLDGTRMPNAETTPKASTLDGTRSPNAEIIPKASRLDGTRMPNAETTPKASRPDGTTTPNAEITPKALSLDGAITPDLETTQKSLRLPQSRVHQLAREFSKKIRNTTTQDAEVPQASIEVSKEHPPWLKRLKKKGTNGVDSDDSDTSPQPPPKQSSKLLRQKSLTLGRFNSTKDVHAAATSDPTEQSSKGNTSVPEKRKAFTMSPSASADAASIQVSVRSTTLPKVHSVSSLKTNTPKVPTSSVIISQAQTPSPPVLSRVPSSTQMRITPTKSIPEHSHGQVSEIIQATEETNGAGLVTTADEVQLQSKNSKHKSSTLHRLSVVDMPNEGHNIKRAVSEANLVQQDMTANESEPQQRQRFKGWVKSLVDKFSSK